MSSRTLEFVDRLIDALSYDRRRRATKVEAPAVGFADELVRALGGGARVSSDAFSAQAEQSEGLQSGRSSAVQLDESSLGVDREDQTGTPAAGQLVVGEPIEIAGRAQASEQPVLTEDQEFATLLGESVASLIRPLRTAEYVPEVANRAESVDRIFDAIESSIQEDRGATAVDQLDRLDTPTVSRGTVLASPPDAEAFAAFYRRFVPRLVGFLRWQGVPLVDAADIVQETMIDAYRQWSTITSNREMWARRVASRKWARRLASVREDSVAEIPDRPALLQITDVEAWEQRHHVLKILDQLPSRQRQVLAWALDGYKPAEIARELQLSLEAVRLHLAAARRNVANLLGREKGEQGMTG